MSRLSREKGKRGEREAAKELSRLFGIEARRGVQFQGGKDSPDVIAAIPGVHWEVKRTERLSLYPAMAQAASDCGDGVPVILHRANGQEWLAICRLNDLGDLAARIYEIKAGHG